MLKTFLLALLLIGATAVFFRLSQEESSDASLDKEALLTNSDFSQEVIRPLNIPERPLLPYRKKIEVGLIVTPEHRTSFPGKLLNRALPMVFSETEGSYADLGGLFESKAPARMDLRSEWVAPYLFPDRNLPSLRLRILQDPLTGEFNLSGGSVAFPGSPLEAGYETDLNHEKHRGVIQWRKSF